jgi:hypothetical protein
MEKLSWTNRVKNEAALHRLKEERNILKTIQSRKAKWIDQNLPRNFLVKHVEGKIVGGIEVTGRQGRRRK